MREIDYGCPQERSRFVERSLYRLSNFTKLDDTVPVPQRMIVKFDSDGNESHENLPAIDDMAVIRRLKGIAITSEYSQLKELGEEKAASFVLHNNTSLKR